METREAQAAFAFNCEPLAEKVVEEILLDCIAKSSYLKKFQNDLEISTSTNLFDWIDHVEVGYSEELDRKLTTSGFEAEVATPLYRTFHHPRAQLPRIVVKDETHPFLGVAIQVERIADFLMVRGLSNWIEGTPLSPFRRSLISKENGVYVYVVERRAAPTMEPVIFKDGEGEMIYLVYEKWQTRPRNFDDPEGEEDGMRQAIFRAEEIVELVGLPLAASIILDVERRYWQARNLSAQLQKNRQDRLGLGWANHDHHTFRSSRKHFRSLVRLFEILGFRCRERFYAGVEAGWGAQVMEHPQVRLVLFLDVDLAPDELSIDFAHQVLPELTKLGTVGLWCALHGESILNAGMHHLEAQFNFEKLEKDLSAKGIKMMPAFSNFSYLKQAFTEGEMWPVNPIRVQRLLDRKLITNEQAERFLKNGAIGSHLENLERKEGYKGFNQKNVSYIIQKTDPRNIFPEAQGA
jgi:hypothetical protein